jgi:hypothetical protein
MLCLCDSFVMPADYADNFDYSLSRSIAGLNADYLLRLIDKRQIHDGFSAFAEYFKAALLCRAPGSRSGFHLLTQLMSDNPADYRAADRACRAVIGRLVTDDAARRRTAKGAAGRECQQRQNHCNRAQAR